MDMSLSKLWDIVKDREAWRAAVHGIEKSWTWLSDWTTTTPGKPLCLVFSEQQWGGGLHPGREWVRRKWEEARQGGDSRLFRWQQEGFWLLPWVSREPWGAVSRGGKCSDAEVHRCPLDAMVEKRLWGWGWTSESWGQVTVGSRPAMMGTGPWWVLRK